MFDPRTGEFIPSVEAHNGKSLDAIMRGQPNGVEEKEQQALKIRGIGDLGGRAYTITFTDMNLCKYKESYLYCTVMSICQKTRGVTDFAFVPEYSEAGRYHLHGAILCKELKQYGTVANKLRRAFGIVKVKDIHDTVGWYMYCRKQYADPEKEEQKRADLKEKHKDDGVAIKKW